MIIYQLIDPRTNEIRYVGKTNNLHNRMLRHKRDAKGKNTSIKRIAWLRGLYLLGLEPIVEIITECEDADWAEHEKHYIALRKEEGCKLTNMTGGGEGAVISGEAHWNYGQHLSLETKNKIGKQTENRWQQGMYDFHRRPLVERWGPDRALKHTERMKEYNSTKIVSQSTREKISKTQSRPIILIDVNGIICFEFANAQEAAIALGCKRSNVNNRRRFGGLLLHKYIVKYKDEHGNS